MSIFSRSSSNQTVVDTIPSEIRQAVSVMGDTHGAESASLPKAPTGSSPFLDGGMSAPSAVPAPAPSLKPLFDESTSKPARNNRLLLWGGIGMAGMLVVAGVVYWYMTQSKEEMATPEIVPAPETTIRVTTTEPEPTPVLPFSLTGPNYLSLDTETVTPATFQALLGEKKQLILNAGIVKPVEFLLTDKNNNPVAFSRVAFLMNIDLSQPFLAALAESFSLYLYNDQGQVRQGLALSFGTVDGPTLFAKEREGSFPYAFRSFLYEGLTVPRDVTFRSGVYKEQAVRFVNIDEASQASFDYALRGTTWMIGTSKETLRALLDAN
jgi:hypothetical protein